MSKKIVQATQAAAQPLAAQMGFELIDVEYKRESVGMVLTVYIDKPDGVSMEDCQRLSQELDPILDALPDMPEGYFFSVSSPGLDRPLKKDADYQRNLGKYIEVHLYAPLQTESRPKQQKGDQAKRFRGCLVAFDSETVRLDCEGQPVQIPRAAISSAKPYITF